MSSFSTQPLLIYGAAHSTIRDSCTALGRESDSCSLYIHTHIYSACATSSIRHPLLPVLPNYICVSSCRASLRRPLTTVHCLPALIDALHWQLSLRHPLSATRHRNFRRGPTRFPQTFLLEHRLYDKTSTAREVPRTAASSRPRGLQNASLLAYQTCWHVLFLTALSMP